MHLGDVTVSNSGVDVYACQHTCFFSTTFDIYAFSFELNAEKSMAVKVELVISKADLTKAAQR